MNSHLDQTDHGHERAEVPEPADDKVRPPPPEPKHQAGDGQQENARKSGIKEEAHLELRRQMEKEQPFRVDDRGVGIEDGQVGRPKDLFQVDHVGNQGIGHSGAQRQPLEAVQGGRGRLALHRHRGDGDHDGQHGDLLDPEQIEARTGEKRRRLAGGRLNR